MTYGATDSRYLIGKETSYADGGTPSKDIGLVTSVSDNNTREIIRISKGIGQRGLAAVFGGTIDSGDTVTFQFQHGRILEYVFGKVEHEQEATSDDWKHVFSLTTDNPTFASESSESGTADSGTLKKGNAIDSFSLNIELNGVLTGEFTTLAAEPENVTTATSKVISSLPTFHHQNVKVKLDDVDIPEVQNFSINFEGVVQRAYGIGGPSAKQGGTLEANFTFNGTVGLSNNDYNTLFQGDTKCTIELVGDNGVAIGSGKRAINLKLKDCVLSQKNKVVSVGELIFVDIEGEGVLEKCETVDNIASGDW